MDMMTLEGLPHKVKHVGQLQRVEVKVVGPPEEVRGQVVHGDDGDTVDRLDLESIPNGRDEFGP